MADRRARKREGVREDGWPPDERAIGRTNRRVISGSDQSRWFGSDVGTSGEVAVGRSGGWGGGLEWVWKSGVEGWGE